MSSEFFDLFQRAQIINLPEREDRRMELRDELDRADVTIDGQKIAFFSAVKPDSAGDFPSIGARGCFLSHLGVLRAARDADLDLLLILEDDAHFGRTFLRQQRSAMTALDGIDWDIFYAGYTPLAELIPTGPITAIPADFPLQTSHAMALRKPVIAAAIPYLEAILARPAGSPEGGPMHVDGAYNWFRAAYPQFRTVVATPQLITQRASRSDITPGAGWRERLPLTGWLRRLKNRSA
ncbi:glycosyltransferase family 25 protein [Pseudodonghicola flavimaris]|uniref:Glycosyltransferase family 25 protein n=1 Tax=Pseudodonghicola flavimaris TaxID=3050036 RepID=A0ABT7EZP5_9RHOB|nr:glycosyltransferase family 25 protein [Pseudodonghicola flavimaris]MDK3017815.1 glycosyltransferase family 25 protein [Pseudodonghicola flavimaris]